MSEIPPICTCRRIGEPVSGFLWNDARGCPTHGDTPERFCLARENAEGAWVSVDPYAATGAAREIQAEYEARWPEEEAMILAEAKAQGLSEEHAAIHAVTLRRELMAAAWREGEAYARACEACAYIVHASLTQSELAKPIQDLLRTMRDTMRDLPRSEEERRIWAAWERREAKPST